MKTNILKMILPLLLSVMVFSCSEDFMETNKGDNTLSISPDKQTVVLDENNYNDDAITLTWSSGTNYGSGKRINYTLELAKAGTNFSKSYKKDMGTATYRWSDKVEDLNNILINNLGLVSDSESDIEARVTASVKDVSEDQIATTSFKIKTYTPVTSTLYMIGDATPTGWSVDTPTEMIKERPGVFSWNGKLRGNSSFKFITTIGQFVPSYNKNADNDDLFYRTSFDEPDDQYKTTEDGYYQITVNLLTKKITIEQFEKVVDRFEQVYFVGSPSNWYFIEMVKDPLRLNLWHYNAIIDWNGGGQFKFGTVKDWNDMLFASQADAPYTSTDVVFNGSDDNKWMLTEDQCGKGYKITLDVTKGQEKMIMTPFTPYEGLYLVGDATPNGWDINKADPMKATDDPNVFTWSGKLNAGEFKITCDKKDDWSGAWFMPDSPSKTPTGEEEHVVFIDKSSSDMKALYPDLSLNDVDMKWKINEAGNYSITFNQLTEVIVITKK